MDKYKKYKTEENSISFGEAPKPVLKSDIVFGLDETQELLAAPLIERMLADPNGGMVIGTLCRYRSDNNMETVIHAAFKFIDFQTACRIIEYANSRKEETEND